MAEATSSSLVGSTHKSFLGILTRRQPLEAHLARALGQQGVETKFGWFGALNMVP
jgi:hypothetical protein